MINLGFISIHIYSICILLSVISGYFLIIRESKRQGFEEKTISDMIFYMILFGIIGARLYYVVFNLNYYDNIFDVFKVWEGGLAIHGGILLGFLSILYFCNKKNLDFIKILDIVVVGLILGQSIGRWGNFFNGEAHGMVTTLAFLKSFHLPSFIIEGMYIDGNYYIPTFLIESIWCLIGFIIMILVRKKKYMRVGFLTSFYLIWYGFERFIVEGMRTDSLMLLSLKMAQIVSIVMILIGIVLLVYSFKKNKMYN